MSILTVTILRYYSVTIFCKIGMPPYTTAIITATVNMSGSLLNLFVVDTVSYYIQVMIMIRMLY